MAIGQGRDQLGPMERLTQILTMLSHAPSRTLAADQILAVVHYGADTVEDQRDQLRRDVRHLESLGWEITNIASAGEPARYRLVAVDNRLRVQFTPEQRAELLRAALAAGLTDLVDDLGGQDGDQDAADEVEVLTGREPPALELAHRAVAQHCLLHFRYRDKQRAVHPHGLHVRPGGWYLVGTEDGDTAPKTFVVTRMSQVEIGEPGTAVVPQRAARPQLDPITWLVDPPMEAVVVTSRDHRPHVEAMVGRAVASEQRADGTVRLTIPVTHRAAFRRRLYELGSRVLLVGPHEIRDEVRAELAAVAGTG